MQTIADLLRFARSQAVIRSNNYFEPSYARPEEVAEWQSDKRRRDAARRKVLRTFPGRIQSAEVLRPGNYYHGRLIITDGDIIYVSGQYSPTEIYQAVLDYMEATN